MSNNSGQKSVSHYCTPELVLDTVSSTTHSLTLLAVGSRGLFFRGGALKEPPSKTDNFFTYFYFIIYQTFILHHVDKSK